MEKKNLNRREFLSCGAMIGAAGLVAPAILTGCANENKQTPLRQEGEYYVPELPDKAVEGRELKVGVVGCGGRGSGAVINLLDAADGITVTALGDVFQDRVEGLRQKLINERKQEVPFAITDNLCSDSVEPSASL